MRKKFLLFVFILATVCATVYAHPGRTDSSGGHMNHSTGEYHYHHGQSAHQHPDGVCPYDDRYSNYAFIEKDREDDYEEDNGIQTLEEYCEENGIELEESKEESETNKYVWIYTIIGLLISLANLLSVFKDSFKMNRETKEPIYIFLISALVILAIAIFAYWILYSVSFRLSQSLFEDDVIVTHICANIPTYFMIYYVVKGRKKGE